MSAALYALAGTVIGVLGAVLADAVRAQRDTRRVAREALRVVCSDFTAQLTRARRYSQIHHRGPEGSLDQEVWQQLQVTFTEARTRPSWCWTPATGTSLYHGWPPGAWARASWPRSVPILAHGVGHGPVGGLVSAWPALALVGSFELMTSRHPNLPGTYPG